MATIDREASDPLSVLRQELASDPANLDIANRYWNALGAWKAHDVRSGRYVIECHRNAAISSRQGVIALADAYREMFNESGEAPRREYFDEDLVRALETAYLELADHERVTVEWVLDSLDQGTE
jgi:hypothetical protein